jgi:hypothetical protein
MSFTNVTPIIDPVVTSKQFTLTPAAVGDFILMGITCPSNNADYATALSSSNVTWAPIGSPSHILSSAGNTATCAIFLGKVTSTSSAVVTVTTNAGTTITLRALGSEFSNTLGFSALTLDNTGTVDVVTGAKMAPVTPTRSGDLYWGCCYDNGTATAGTTSGFTYKIDANGNPIAYNTNCANATQSPNLGDAGSDGTTGISVMLYEAATGESGSFAITLPNPTTNLSGKIAHKGSFAITLPRLSTSLSGSVAVNTESGPFHITLPNPTVSLAGTDTALMNGTYRWNGTMWQPYQLGINGLSPSVTARGLGGITTTISATAPSSGANGDIWINSSAGNQINQYNGTTWVAITWNATNVITAGTITASLIQAATITGSLIAAGTITAGNIAANTITASQIASNTITAAQIAANTITATQIAANTITAAQIAATTITGSLIAAGTITGNKIAAGTIAANLLVSGIVVAGIVDSTTITTATLNAPVVNSAQINAGTIIGTSIIADGTSGEVLIYSGTPGSGNLVGSWSGAAGSDPYTNPYPYGLAATNLTMYGASTPTTPSFGSAVMFTDTTGAIQFVTASGFQGGVGRSQGNVNSFSNGTTGYSHLNTPWAIPANDAVHAGTCYRLKVFGTCDNGNANQSLGMQIAAFGGTWATSVITVGAASSGRGWKCEATILIVSAGSGGSAIFNLDFFLGGNLVSTITTTGTIDTTSSTTFQIFGTWNGGSSYNVTGIGSTLERW